MERVLPNTGERVTPAETPETLHTGRRRSVPPHRHSLVAWDNRQCGGRGGGGVTKDNECFPPFTLLAGQGEERRPRVGSLDRVGSEAEWNTALIHCCRGEMAV